MEVESIEGEEIEELVKKMKEDTSSRELETKIRQEFFTENHVLLGPDFVHIRYISALGSLKRLVVTFLFLFPYKCLGRCVGLLYAAFIMHGIFPMKLSKVPRFKTLWVKKNGKHEDIVRRYFNWAEKRKLRQVLEVRHRQCTHFM